MPAPLRRRAPPILLILCLPAAAAALAPTTATASPTASAPRCFGAAARVPDRPCTNPALERSVTPTPEAALLVPDAPCAPLQSIDVLNVCTFAMSASSARETVALIGDSHASHWRAALTVAGLDEGWQGVSLTRSSCPFSRARPRIAVEGRAPCRAWNAAVLAWLATHPEVHTIFVSAHSGARVFRDPGRNALETKVAGYTAAWAALPASVLHIVVLRDVPTHPQRTADCIAAALAARRPPMATCAVPRAGALHPDPEVVAAERLGTPRMSTIDLTPFMCDPRWCFPVVGGVLVNKDTDHLSRAFSASLGTYLLSRLARLRRRW